MRIAAGVCLAALALAACNKPADEAAEGTATPKAQAPVPAGIDAAPKLKAGLWEISTKVAGMEGKARNCVDPEAQADSAVLGQGLDRRNCSKSDWNRIPNGVAFEFVCDNGGTVVTSKGTVTGDFSKAYSMEADASITRNGITQSGKQKIDAVYVGECPAGMNPGDKQITVNGRTFNVPGTVAEGAPGPSVTQ